MSKPLHAALLLCVWLAGCTGIAFVAGPLQGLKGPPGFQVSVFSDQVPNAREMTLGTHDTVFGASGEGKVYALTGMQDGRAAHAYVIATDLQMPIKGRSCSEFAQPALRLGALGRHRAGASTRDGCFPRRTTTRSSSPNTDHGTVQGSRVTVCWWCTSARMARSADHSLSSRVSWMARKPWAARPTCNRYVTAACWYRTTTMA